MISIAPLGHGRSKGKCMGFKNPEIVQTALSVNAQFESKTPIDGKIYSVVYTILSYDQETNIMQVKMDGNDGWTNYRNNVMLIPIESGKTVELACAMGLGPHRIYLQVLDTSVPNKAIMAIGQKRAVSGKAF